MTEMAIRDSTRYDEDTMFKVQAAITSLGYSGQPVLDIIGAIQNKGILFRERAEDSEPDVWQEPVIKATVAVPAVATDEEVGQPEEPIEDRLRRAFLNGFREGVDRASNTYEGWGRWDA